MTNPVLIQGQRLLDLYDDLDRLKNKLEAIAEPKTKIEPGYHHILLMMGDLIDAIDRVRKIAKETYVVVKEAKDAQEEENAKERQGRDATD